MNNTNTPDSSNPSNQERRYSISHYNQRMAQRIVKRAHLNEQGVAVAFTYNNLLTTLLIGSIEDIARYIPSVGEVIELVISILTFYFHRIVLVTDKNTYIYRDLPFHIPGKLLTSYGRHPGLVSLGGNPRSVWSKIIRRGQLTFDDGFIVYHGILWIRRAQYIEQEANIFPDSSM
jgi:hypothetical protein